MSRSTTELPVKIDLQVVRTVRSVYFACGCFAEYSIPNPYRVEEWNPQPCNKHKTDEGREALVEAAKHAASQ